MVRIGLPLVLVVIFVMPVAYYPAYRLTAVDPSVTGYWRQWVSLPFWPCGPQWFLLQLLALNVVAGALHRWAPQWGGPLGRLSSSARIHPTRYCIGLATASALAYVPMALIFSPWEWGHLGPFAVQLSRPLHYCVYFFAGMSIGVYGLERGLLASDGLLARRWLAWMGGALAGFLLWIAPTASIMANGNTGPLALQIAAALGFVVACATGCFFFAAVFIRFATNRLRTMDSLSDNAYGMYLVHYVFVVWLQYALLGAALFAFAKAGIVFGITLLLSWTVSSAMHGLPLGSRLIGVRR